MTTVPASPLAALVPPTLARLTDRGFEAVAYLLASGWPKEPLPEPTLLLYCALLSHLPDEIALQATARAVAVATFLPKPAEILAQAHELLAERGEGPPNADAAWAAVVDAIRRGQTAGMHPLAATALQRLGGLAAITHATYADLPSFQRRFDSIHRALANRHFLALAGLATALPAPEGADAPVQYVPDPN